MNKHTVTLPNGETAKRNSKTRVYEYAVAGYRSAESNWRRLHDRSKACDERAEQHRAHIERLQAGGDLTQSVVDGRPLYGDRDGEIRAYTQYMNEQLAHAERLRGEAAAAGQSYTVCGWAGSRDLAMKRANAESKFYDRMHILPATLA